MAHHQFDNIYIKRNLKTRRRFQKVLYRFKVFSWDQSGGKGKQVFQMSNYHNRYHSYITFNTDKSIVSQ